MNTLRTSLVPLLPLALVACGPSVDLQVDIGVPAALQQQFDADNPGQIVLDATSETTFDAQVLLGVICDATDEERLARWTFSGRGCALESEILVWVEPVSIDGACDEGAELPTEASVEPPASAWTASGLVFAGQTRGCEPGSDFLELTLEAPRDDAR